MIGEAAAAPGGDLKQQIVDFMTGFTAETTPGSAAKNAFAERTGAEVYLVTQFCFEAAPMIAWDRRIRAEGNRLPVHIGVPGLATIRTLLAHARACGIGPGVGFLTRQARNVTKLMTVSAPDRLIGALAAYRAGDPACGIAGVHVYPLGQVELRGRRRLVHHEEGRQGLHRRCRPGIGATAGRLKRETRGRDSWPSTTFCIGKTYLR